MELHGSTEQKRAFEESTPPVLKQNISSIELEGNFFSEAAIQIRYKLQMTQMLNKTELVWHFFFFFALQLTHFVVLCFQIQSNGRFTAQLLL